MIVRNPFLFISFALLTIANKTLAQCEDHTASANIVLECLAGEAHETHYTYWSGGTAPYTVWYTILGISQGPFETYTNGGSYTTPVTVPSAQTECGVSEIHVMDANGCEFYTSAYECIHWIDPAGQFMVDTLIWDPLAGTATVVLVDDPAVPGNIINEGMMTFGLYRTDIYDPGIGGYLSQFYHSSPPRLEIPDLVPGEYELAILSGVLCEGVVLAFEVADPSPQLLMVEAVVMLGGNMLGGLMSDELRSAGLLPYSEPYSALGYFYQGTGGTTVEAGVFSTTGPNAIVDWVIVELRDPSTPSVIVNSKSALVQRDGDVVALDGVSALNLNSTPGNYHIAIRHRNHLGVMTAAPIALSASPTTIDFTDPATPTWGTEARKNVNGTMVLWPGDANFDGVVRYTGAGNDRDMVLQAVGGSTPTNVVGSIYSGADINLDGEVKYSGDGNDRDIILQTIGGVIPTAVKAGQVP